MDELDKSILKCLKVNSRMRASEIGKRVNLSVSSVIDRIHKLEDQGVIQRYTVVLDPNKTGHKVAMMICIKMTQPGFYDSIIEKILANPNVIQCHYLTGEVDFILNVTASSPENLQKIHHEISMLEGVASITSYYVIKTIKNDFSVL